MVRLISIVFSSALVILATTFGLVSIGHVSVDALPAQLTSWFVAPNSPEAALSGDPGNPYRWCDYAENMAESGNLDAARNAMQRAAELGSEVPPVLVRAANFWMSEGEVGKALGLLASSLLQTDAFDRVIFSYYRRLGIPYTQVLERGLPDDRRTWEAYFTSLLTWAEPPNVDSTWAALDQRHWTSDDAAAAYTRYLIRNNRFEDAVQTWATQLGSRAGDFPTPNRIYNGDLERELTAAPLDWSIRPVAGVRVDRVPEGPDGTWALRVDFDGSGNLVYRHVAQTAYLPPGVWRLEAQIRTEAITTNEGIYLNLTSPARRLNWQSAKLNGATDGWQTLTRTLRTTGATTPVTITISRDESLKIDNKLAGTLWLAEIRLSRLD